ncbi:MAG: imm11 family protein [Flectobacillus sp.]|uniref:imm11 family protein n=1 Tax=Flectobacillus sp. TaxID=50419 RepID=UPI003B9BE07A
MKKTAYILKWDIYHSEDPGYDAFCVAKEKYLSLSVHLSLFANDDWRHKSGFLPPKILYFQSNFDMIPQYDYPYTDLYTPIISKRMLKVLLEISSFDYSAIPVTMIDFTYLEKPFDEEGNLKSDVPVNNDYVAIYLLNHLDIIDFDNSSFEKGFLDVLFFSNLVIKEPELGLPSVFKLKDYQVPLFVSSEAKEALERNGIKGCVFEPVEVTPYEG